MLFEQSKLKEIAEMVQSVHEKLVQFQVENNKESQLIMPMEQEKSNEIMTLLQTSQNKYEQFDKENSAEAQYIWVKYGVSTVGNFFSYTERIGQQMNLSEKESSAAIFLTALSQLENTDIQCIKNENLQSAAVSFLNHTKEIGEQAKLSHKEATTFMFLVTLNVLKTNLKL